MNSKTKPQGKAGKIIQIAVNPETEESYETLMALTEDGRVLRMVMVEEPSARAWVEVPTDNFVHRLGKLIGE